MRHAWNEQSFRDFASTYAAEYPRPFLEQVFATRLLGADTDLVLHGGGNTSFKGMSCDLLGSPVETLFIKASGCNMAEATTEDFVLLDLKRLQKLNCDIELDDEKMAFFFATSLIRSASRQPSIETLLHAFLPFVCIDHTHPAPVLALADRTDAEQCIREAFTPPVAVIDYEEVGLSCARAVAEAVRKMPYCKGVIILHHGLVTWGETGREAYESTMDIVEQADNWLEKNRINKVFVKCDDLSVERAKKLYRSVAPVIRGCLTHRVCEEAGRPQAVSMAHLADPVLLSMLENPGTSSLLISTPITADYIIRTGRLPLLMERPCLDKPDELRSQIKAACGAWRSEYGDFIRRAGADEPMRHIAEGAYPSVLFIPGIGAVCRGFSLKEAAIAADITAQELGVKRAVSETGGKYRNLDDRHCFNMEFRSYQRAKLSSIRDERPLYGCIVLVTGAAGAIGSGVCEYLLGKGCQIVASDLPSPALYDLAEKYSQQYGPHRIAAVPIDVTDEDSVRKGFEAVVERWGGLDAVVVNAGIAHVSPLAEMDIEAFRKLERVNTEGALLTIKQAAGMFKLQNIGGDIVLVSTKNVFAPGASFGAYSATKAAAHQLARIASLELASIGVRVNMVSPDAVFSHGNRKSGLWETVGPDRMKSRGLDEAGLEEYYRNRNLLKARVKTSHVAAAVEFLLERRTPTTGATIPVDGGLPDATPR